MENIFQFLPCEIILKILNEYIFGKEYYYNRYTKNNHKRFCKKNLIYSSIEKLYRNIKIKKDLFNDTMSISIGKLNILGRNSYAINHITTVQYNLINMKTSCYKYMWVDDRDFDGDYSGMSVVCIYQKEKNGRFNAK